MIHSVYIITNVANDKVYIGQSKNPIQRKKGHWSGCRHAGKGHLYDAMRKHGLENFKFEILEECSEETIDDRERYWIATYESTNPLKGYNKESGGHVLKTLHEETKRKIAIKLTGVPFTKERCRNISDSLRGKACLKNRRENNSKRGKRISERLIGILHSEEHKHSVSLGLTKYFATHDVKHTEESRRHMSEAQKIVGKRRTERACIEVNHPDAQPKECPVCRTLYSPKKLTMTYIKRHVTKRWCSRSCGRIAQNTPLSLETRQKISKSMKRLGKKKK